MFRFSLPQKTVNINGTLFGGQPGENATVMCSSIFFAGHKIVQDPLAGRFDKSAARRLLHEEFLLAKKFALPRAINVIGETGQALVSYLTFLLEETECPLFVDSTNKTAILEAFRYFKNSRAMERLIYNSIDAYHQEAELAEIKKLGIKNAVVLAFTIHHAKPADKLALLLGDCSCKVSATGEPPSGGLLEKVKAIGVENILIDVGVLDLHSTAWSAMAIREIKAKTGLPCGCAPTNALFNLQKANEYLNAEKEARLAAAVAIYSSIIYQGADWLFYGAIRNAKWAYPAVATANSLMASGAMLNGTKLNCDTHPRFMV